MKKFLLLTKASFDSVISGAGKGSNKRKLSTVALYCILALYLAAFSGFMSYGAYEMFSPLGLQKIIPALLFFGASVITLLLTVLGGNSFLYKPKDIEILLSLPVSHAAVMASKAFGLYLYNLVYVLVLCLPSGIVYLVLDGGGVASYIFLVLISFLVPLLPMLIGCIVSFFIGLLLKYVKRKNVFTILFSIAFFALYMIFVQNSNGIFEYLAANGGAVIDAVTGWAPTVGYAVKGLYGSITDILIFTVINVAPYFLVFPIMSKKYATITASSRQAVKKENYILEKSQQTGKFYACFKKEFGKVLSSATYFMNSFMGCLLMVVFAIMMISNNIHQGQISNDIISMIVSITAMLACTMTATTSCTISLEGKTLWIYKTAPVDTFTVLKAKMAVNIAVYTPFAIAYALVMGIACDIDHLNVAIMMLLPVTAIVYNTLITLIINLAKPKLNWSNETQVIKQSASVALSMLEGVCFTVLIGVMLFLIPWYFDIAFEIVGTACIVMITALSAALYNLLRTWGVKKFNNLY